VNVRIVVGATRRRSRCSIADCTECRRDRPAVSPVFAGGLDDDTTFLYQMPKFTLHPDSGQDRLCFGVLGKKESRGAPRVGLSFLNRTIRCTTILGIWYTREYLTELWISRGRGRPAADHSQSAFSAANFRGRIAARPADFAAKGGTRRGSPRIARRPPLRARATP
jgi:hypothetical protein